jgi:hypothetical protein
MEAGSVVPAGTAIAGALASAFPFALVAMALLAHAGLPHRTRG